MSNLIGQSLGRYHILEQLGEGGMATVYKAYDTRLETDVAVKVIRAENILPSALERSRKRFEREAKALARLTHPNIVKVTDYGEYEGKPYLVMEYLPGGTLKQKLGKPIPWNEAIAILLPIARALDFAHRQNMIHRDVKPSNILITADGEPMLTDFGIAKIIDDEATQDLTGTSAAVGTPEYMAPEQATAKTVDHRADIYALGVVLYEMVTGRKPFVADTPMAVLIKHATESLPRPSQFVPSLPDGVEKVLVKTLSKNPNERYQRMGELSVAWQSVFESKRELPVSASQVGTKKKRSATSTIDETLDTVEEKTFESKNHTNKDKGIVKPREPKKVVETHNSALSHVTINLSNFFVRRLVVDAKFSPSYEFICVAADNGVYFYDVERLSKIGFWRSKDMPTSVAVSPLKDQVVVGTDTGTINFLNASNLILFKTIEIHTEGVNEISISNSGKKIATVSDDGAICVISNKGSLLHRFKWHKNSVSSVRMSADESVLVVGSMDCFVSIWDLTKGDLLDSKQFKNGIISVAIANQSETIAIGTESGKIYIWDRRTNNLRDLNYHSDWVGCLSFSPDGLLLASGSEDKDISIWDFRTGKLLKVLSGHADSVVSVQFSPDGEELLSGSLDGTCILWEVPEVKKKK
ncbi:MAG: protein kinase domain-containing protein [Chloroflexota bacterium]